MGHAIAERRGFPHLVVRRQFAPCAGVQRGCRRHGLRGGTLRPHARVPRWARGGRALERRPRVLHAFRAPEMNTTYSEVEPKRAEIDQLEGAAVVEFGSPWCGYCRRAQPLLAQAFAEHPKVRHFKIADASGKR